MLFQSGFFNNAVTIRAELCNRVRMMKKFMYDFCLKETSSRAAPDDNSGIQFLADVATLCVVVRFSLSFQQPRSVCQRLPTLGSGGLSFSPKLLRRFLRGAVVTTAHGLVTPPASAFVDGRAKMILMNRIFARVMSGFVLREEARLQDTAAARIAGKIPASHLPMPSTDFVIKHQTPPVLQATLATVFTLTITSLTC
jgi:hypothetical protein